MPNKKTFFEALIRRLLPFFKTFGNPSFQKVCLYKIFGKPSLAKVIYDKSFNNLWPSDFNLRPGLYCFNKFVEITINQKKVHSYKSLLARIWGDLYTFSILNASINWQNKLLKVEGCWRIYHRLPLEAKGFPRFSK